jgi:hypothetical protein
MLRPPSRSLSSVSSIAALALALGACSSTHAAVQLTFNDPNLFLWSSSVEVYAYDGATLPELSACAELETRARRGTLPEPVGQSGTLAMCDANTSSHASMEVPWDPFLVDLPYERAVYLAILRDDVDAITGLGCYVDDAIGSAALVPVIATARYNEEYLGVPPPCASADALCSGACP